MMCDNWGNEIGSPGGIASAPGMSRQEVSPVADPQYTPPTKPCIRCAVAKPLAEFEADSRRSDGKRNTCHSCRRALRKADPQQVEQTRERLRIRSKTRQRRSSLAYEIKRRDLTNRSPEYRARAAVRRKLRDAVEAGRIRRPDLCQRCGGGGPIEAHHTDYSRPFDVEWLCAPCHRQRHQPPEAA